MLTKNIDATDVYRIGFDSQAYLDKRLFTQLQVFYTHCTDAGAVNVAAILRDRPDFEHTILRIFRFPPFRRQKTTLTAEISRAGPAANLYSIDPEGDVRRPVEMVQWSLRQDFRAQIQSRCCGPDRKIVGETIGHIARTEPE